MISIIILLAVVVGGQCLVVTSESTTAVPTSTVLPEDAPTMFRRQASVWGQCGGVGWSGATTCASGSVCVAQNSYYSQCIPGTSTILTTTSSTKSSTGTSTPSSTSTSPTTAPSGVKYFITFGDSYSQTGFVPTGAAPAAGNPLGNPNLVGYTTDNGLNWIGDLVEVYNTSLMLSYNFAYGGATVDASLVPPYANTVLSLIDQVNQFKQYIPSGPWSASNTLFGIWMGVNDVGNAYYSSTWSTLVGRIMNSYFAEVQVLYNSGARNFLFLTVPPTQYTPLFISEGTSVQSAIASAITQFNSALVTRAAAFQTANPAAKYWIYDTQTPFLAAIKNPTAYGVPDATCYNADGVSCLWWNNYHPSQVIQNLVAKGVAAALKGVFW